MGSDDTLNSHERSLLSPITPRQRKDRICTSKYEFLFLQRLNQNSPRIFPYIENLCAYQHCIFYVVSFKPIHTPSFMVYFASSVVARTVFTAIFIVFCVALPINQPRNKAEREIGGKAAELLNSS